MINAIKINLDMSEKQFLLSVRLINYWDMRHYTIDSGKCKKDKTVFQERRYLSTTMMQADVRTSTFVAISCDAFMQSHAGKDVKISR